MEIIINEYEIDDSLDLSKFGKVIVITSMTDINPGVVTWSGQHLEICDSQGKQLDGNEVLHVRADAARISSVSTALCALLTCQRDSA